MKLSVKVLFLVLFGFSPAFAKTVIISDIDDTLKNAYVLDKSDSVLNAVKIENMVLGMNAAFRALQQADSTASFYYVSNAPRPLMGSLHKQFLEFNEFPAGELRMRPGLFQGNFKVAEIRRILEAERPQKLILIGDNGQKDIEVYKQIEEESPGLEILTFIRQTYSSGNREYRGVPLASGQIGIVTSLDMILHLYSSGFVTAPDTADFTRAFLGAYLQEDERKNDGYQAIPAWMDCRDFQWTAPDAELIPVVEYSTAKTRILNRCSQSAVED